MSAVDVERQITIAAPAAAVYDALVRPEGLRGWWSTGAEAAGEVGGLVRFPWSRTDHTTFRIERLAPPREAVWRCVAQRDRHLPRPDEWVGTTVSFTLDERDGATTVAFAHRGLAALECGDACTRGWEHFLLDSLRSLVETGAGSPWDAKS